MPIFEYKCDSCGTKFEKLLRRSDDLSALKCPDCGEQHLSQQYSTFAARANGATSAAAEMPSCPSGMCSNPGMCGRN
jgi:putative FmdB family regulatory protein